MIRTFIFAASLACSSFAQAGTVNVTFEGEVNFINRFNFGDVSATFSVGSPFSYTMSFNPTQSLPGQTQVFYRDAITGFNGSAGNYSFSGSTGALNVNNDAPFGPNQLPADFLSIEHFTNWINRNDFSSGSVAAGYPLYGVSISSYAANSSFLSSANAAADPFMALAANPALLANWRFVIFVPDGPNSAVGIASGVLSAATVSVVPEPTVAAVLLPGLLAVWLAARRRRTAGP